MTRNYGRFGFFASRAVSWGKYDRGPVKLEYIDDGHPRWVLALWIRRFGITFHWNKKMTNEAVKK